MKMRIFIRCSCLNLAKAFTGPRLIEPDRYIKEPDGLEKTESARRNTLRPFGRQFKREAY